MKKERANPRVRSHSRRVLRFCVLAQVLAACAAALSLSSCVSYYRIAIAVREEAKLDVSDFNRVLVASFVTRTNQALDLDTETMRLLRNQLRNETDLHVVDADLPPLGDFSEVTLKETGQWEEFHRLQKESTEAGEGISLEEWIEFEQENLLTDTEYWREVGEEYQEPLIVTGSLKMIEESRASLVQESLDDQRPGDRPQRRILQERTAYSLKADFYFIDGGTGRLGHRERFMEEVLYRPDEQASGLSTYFELMERVLPQFLLTLSSQEIRRSRVLLM